MAYIIKDEIYDEITQVCIDGYNSKASPLELMEKAWEIIGFPMHCPEHHYLVPAVLLAVYRRLKNDGIDTLEIELEIAKERAKNLLPGFCGWYGACGAAVGSGIFLSILTDTSPYSGETWGQANLLTSKCLKSIAVLGGPRCCKRVSYTAVLTTTQFMNEHFALDIGSIAKPKCRFCSRNMECIKTSCPYYKADS